MCIIYGRLCCRRQRRMSAGKGKKNKKITTNSGTFSCGGLGGGEINLPDSQAGMFARATPLACDVLLQ